MMFRLASLALLAATAFAKSIPANSKVGQKIMSKARKLNDNGDREVEFIAQYYIKYMGCADITQIQQEGGGDEGLLYTQHLVKFALCAEGCGTCYGQYVVDMLEFVDSYTEAKLDEKEYKCEMIRENCYCDNANDDEVCENQCYQNAGMSECIEYEGQEEFEIQRYLECAEMENNGNNNNNNNNNNNGNNNGDNQNQNWNNGQYWGDYFIAPYCAEDGESIFLGVFYDETCMNRADNSAYGQRNYGQSLPFSSESLVDAGECLSCQEVDRDNNNNNNNQNYNQNQNGNNNWNQEWEPSELCERAYEMAARCEENMDINWQDNSGCTFINEILPRMEAANRKNTRVASNSSSGGGSAAVFAWVFGITTIMFGAYAYFLYRKIKRGSVNLSSQEGAMA